jgi:hypothetical protein
MRISSMHTNTELLLIAVMAYGAVYIHASLRTPLITPRSLSFFLLFLLLLTII